MSIALVADDSGRLRLTPAGKIPRLERAFGVSAGRGMLDLVQHGLPADAAPVLGWLREKARHLLMQWLRALRRGEHPGILLPPAAELAGWLESLPPIHGAPVSATHLHAWFTSLEPALHQLAERAGISPEEWLNRLGEGWQQLGMLCFHLAENGGDTAPLAPFAFLATFVHKVGQDGAARHAPLGLAPQLAGKSSSAALLSLLQPLKQAAAQHDFLRELIDSGAVYRAEAWNARKAYQFLECIPTLEAAGIETRMVNLWRTLPPRAQLEVALEPTDSTHAKPDGAPALNVASLLRFIPRVALGGHYLSDAELAELLAGEDGLVRFRGDWIRLDKEKLQHLLNSWRQAGRMAAGGIPLIAGLRYLLGHRSESLPQLPAATDEMRIVPGEQLERALSSLSLSAPELHLPPSLLHTLRPYQAEGVRFLAGVTDTGFGACLADDMGLGKTLQIIAWLSHLHQSGALEHGAALIVAPASLLENWQQELRRFAPELRVQVLHPYALSPADAHHLRTNPAWLLRRAHVALTTYGMVTRNELLRQCSFPALVLDEAQAIKNADSQRTRAVYSLASPRRVALTGTPVENSPAELHSLFSFLTPGLLGTAKEFNSLIRQLGTDYSPLRRLIRPFTLRRLKSDPALLPELPPRSEQAAYCLLTPEQTRLYTHEVEHLRAVMAEPDPQTRLSLVLPILSRLKQICNHPAQYLGEEFYDPARSGKMMRLAQLARSIAAAGDACLVFTQYRSIMPALHDLLADIFGMPGLMLHGATPIAERQQLVSQFQQAGGPPFFILSLKAAGTGLNLTRASHVIHFDRWWNPAIENQASDRAYRIGQRRHVIIHPLICCGTIEQNIHSMLTRKSAMADALLGSGLESLLCRLFPHEILDIVGSPLSKMPPEPLPTSAV